MTNRGSTANGDDSGTGTVRIERQFTCLACGYAMTHEVGRLEAEVQSTCLDCGDWTTQTAAVEDLVAAARDAAERLSGPVLTERQALAYLLRDVVGVDRQAAAAAMGSTSSNVDNLQRRGREKVADARRVVERLDALRGADETAAASDASPAEAES